MLNPKIINILFFITAILSISNKVYSQEPEFKFYLAFEDATGAKDTVWAIWDSNATSFPGYDTALGEYPQTFLSNNTFKVYIKYNVTDSGRIRAEPYTTISGVNGFNIQAVNYTYPITMRWDSSLFFQNNLPFQINTALLDNEWFFGNWNDINFIQQYNMLLTDSVQLPYFSFGSQDHFPISFQIGGTVVGIKENNLNNRVTVFPNPTNNRITILINKENSLHNIKIMNLTGKELKSLSTYNNSITVELEDLPKGVYLLKVSSKHNTSIKKIIKQ